MDEGGWWATVYRSQRVKHDWVTNTFTFTLYRSPEKLYAGQEATVRTRYGTTDRFKIGKGVRQGCILSPCLFNLYVEMLGSMKPKLESRLPGEISTTSDMPIMSESEEKLKSLLIRLKEERGKAGWKVNFINLISRQPVLYFMANRWGRSGNSDILFSWAQKSLWTVIAAMKLKHPCSLEGKLWQTQIAY